MSEVVGGYKDENESRRASTTYDEHFSNRTWAKTFSKDGPLEWFNLPMMINLDLEMPTAIQDWGGYLKLVNSRFECMEKAGQSWDEYFSNTRDVSEQ